MFPASLSCPPIEIVTCTKQTLPYYNYLRLWVLLIRVCCMNHAVTKYGLTRTGGLGKDITKLRAESTCHPHNQVSRRDWDFFSFFSLQLSVSFWQTHGYCSLCVRAWWIMKSLVYDTGLFWSCGFQKKLYIVYIMYF